MDIKAVITLTGVDGVVFAGADRGELLRDKLQLDKLDEMGLQVEVHLESVWTISYSFFKGVFGPSIISAGSKEAFLSRYRFFTSSSFNDIIHGHIIRVFMKC